ncbi:hypothetical protein MTR67_012731 [Solanum verrucosum]|uniref:Uncharacterized protein n=1 Tax=Solanum verrucosum TaxID=315347 RepID=A0AAF0QF11_SOLVR|nr:hypothetical protein MTR67_012731 [Solanum verrucosum]
MKGVMRFGKKGKLSPRYVGPYWILKRIASIVLLESVAMKDSLSYEDVPVEILDCQFTTATPPQTSSEKLAKSRLTDRPTVRRSDHGLWSMSVDRDLPYPTFDTNYGRPARTVIRSTVRRFDRR